MEPKRPTARSGFEIAIICALAVEADAVRALFDRSWDDEYYGKLSSDPNTYFLGSIGPHNVVLAYRSHLKKTSAAIVAACCRISFPGVKLALIAGVCGVVPFRPRTNTEIVLGDVIISTLTVEHHLSQGGYRRSEEKSTYLASPTVIEEDARAFLAKLESLGTRKMLSTRTSNHLDKLQGQPELQATYPGISHDKLFDTSYPHPQLGNERTCEECGCNGRLVARRRFLQDTPQPAAHFGRIACGDVAIKDGRVRDEIAEQYGVIGFEMESVGVWNAFPCILVMGSCDYADGHNPKTWLRYAAATAAAYVKAILESWAPSATELSRQVNDIRALKRMIPYPRNPDFVGRSNILNRLKEALGHMPQMNSDPQARVSLLGLGGSGKRQIALEYAYRFNGALGHAPQRNSSPQARVLLFGLGGIGKTQIALEYVYWLQSHYRISVFWVNCATTESFHQGYASIADECQIPGCDGPTTNVSLLVKHWLEGTENGSWLMVLDGADDESLFHTSSLLVDLDNKRPISFYLPKGSHGAVLITTRNKRVGDELTWPWKHSEEVPPMSFEESELLLLAKLGGIHTTQAERLMLSDYLEHLPLALDQATTFILRNTIKVNDYLQLLHKDEKTTVRLLNKHFMVTGQDHSAVNRVAPTWFTSFEQIKQQYPFAADLLSFLSFFNPQDISVKIAYQFFQRLPNWYGIPRSETRFVDTLEVLSDFSFLEWESSNSFKISRLLQMAVRLWLTPQGNVNRFWNEALEIISHMFVYGVLEHRSDRTALMSHASAILRFEGLLYLTESKVKACLLHHMAEYSALEGQWDDAERYSRDAIGIGKQFPGLHNPVTLSTMATLASRYKGQGRMEVAELLGEQVLEFRKVLLGFNHPDTLSSIAHLVSLYRQQGRHEEAESLEFEAKRAADLDHDSAYVSASHSGTWGVPPESITRDIDKPIATETQNRASDLPDDIRSLSSDNDDIRSQVSNETTNEEATGKALIRVFLAEEPEFRALCLRALPKLGQQRFVDNLRRLLKSFHKNLSKEAKNEAEKAVAKLLRSRQGRSRISEQLVLYIRQEEGEEEVEGLDKASLNVALEDQARIETWLGRITEKPLASQEHALDSPLEVVEECVDIESLTSGSEEDFVKDEFPFTSELRTFLQQSRSFRKLRKEFMLVFLPPNLRHLLLSIPRKHIWISQDQDLSLSNQLKAWVEDHTHVRWLWWPLSARKRMLRPDEARVFWRCTCGVEQWQEISREHSELVVNILAYSDDEPESRHGCIERRNTKALTVWFKDIFLQTPAGPAASKSSASQRYTPPGNTSSTSSSNHFHSNAVSKPNVSGVSQPSHQQNLTDKQQTQSSAMNPALQDQSWILFAVQGASRILTPCEISVSSNTTDYSVFQELKRCYRMHRGRLRLWFSIWRLEYCQSVKFTRLMVNGVVRDHKDLPLLQEYLYKPRAPAADARNPPISPHLFQALFYTRPSPCTWRIPHECIQAPPGSMHLERIPKRSKSFERDMDSPIWGFEAVFAVSPIYVLAYHCIMVTGPLIFWVWWLNLHPGDLQNASIPMTIILACLSLFWSSAGILTNRSRD